MLRSFCVGALVGFFFGSSKTGIEMRHRVDGFVSGLLQPDEVADQFQELKKDFSGPAERAASGTRDKAHGTGGNGNGAKHRVEGANARTERRPAEGRQTASAVAENPEQMVKPRKEEHATKGEAGVSLEELADTLNAKPSPPLTDELGPS
jgi:hypothetical protein